MEVPSRNLCEWQGFIQGSRCSGFSVNLYSSPASRKLPDFCNLVVFLHIIIPYTQSNIDIVLLNFNVAGVWACRDCPVGEWESHGYLNLGELC